MHECTNHSGEVENGDFLQYRVFVKRVTGSGAYSTRGALLVSFDIVDIADYSIIEFEKAFSLPYTLN
jgi:hypothetical protein